MITPRTHLSTTHLSTTHLSTTHLSTTHLSIRGARTMYRPTPTRALLGCLAAVSLAVTACGGSDDAEPASDAASAPAPTAADDDTSTGSDGVGEAGDGEIREELTDAMGEQGALVDDAIASLPAETTWGIVADQLEADDLEIVGADIRLTFESGTTDNGLFDCTVANSFVEEGQTVTMVYPDGEVTCGQ
jgi:hypothetical protein